MARQPKNTAETPETEVIDHVTGEILPVAQAIANVEFGRGLPSGFRVTKYVSVPMLEVPPGQTMVVQMADAVRVLPPIEGVKQKFKGDHHASTIKAANGEARLFTWTTVFKSEMEKAYPEDAYVGKWFQITRLPFKAGKDYSTYAITEVERATAA